MGLITKVPDLIETIGTEEDGDMYNVELFYYNPRNYIDVFAKSERNAWEKIIEAGYKPMTIVKYG